MDSGSPDRSIVSAAVPADRPGIVAGVTTQYPVLWPVTTRWADNDHYGHVNNVTYYAYFDTAVNAWLIDATGTDIRELPAIGIVAETSCRFHASLSFPDKLQVGLRISRLGRSSITYDLAILRETGRDLELAATGTFVHVYVDGQTRKPVEIPEVIRTAALTLVTDDTEQ